MKFISSKLPFVFFLLFFTQTSIAAEDAWNFIPNASINFKTVNFRVTQKAFDPQYTTLDLGLTAAYKKFYATVDFDQSIKDEAKLFIDNGDSAIFMASREDTTITVGNNIWKSMSVFGGYKFGKTNVLFTNNSNPLDSDTSVTFEEKGLFLGTTYAIFFDEGTLNVGLGYADLDGENNFLQLSGLTRIPGDTTGFSYSISWTAPLSDSLSYNVGLKLNRYRFKDKRQQIPGVTEDFSFDENFTIFTFGVSNYF